MKIFIKFIFLLFLSISTFNTYSQNWSPIRTGVQSNFSCDTSKIIFSLWVDSTEANNGDTIYYLNRVIRPCDTCSANYKYNIVQILNLQMSVSLSTDFFLKNQPQFLQRKITYNNINKSFYLTDTAKFVLLPRNQVGLNWIFDTINNITAHISDKTFSSILGLPDSLQTIILSNGDSILLSKNYGMIKYPAIAGINQYYRLIGLEGTIVTGTKIPSFFDFFNYNNGDQFGYYYWKLNPGEMFQMNDQFIINQKAAFSDSLHYAVSGIWEGLHQDWNVGGVITYHNSFSQNINYYIDPYQFFVLNEETPWVGFDINFFNKRSFEIITTESGNIIDWESSFSTTFFNDSLNRISKETHPILLFYPHYQDTLFNKDLLIEYDNSSGPDYMHHACVTIGMGYNFINIHHFENDIVKNLTFCVLNGDTLVNQLTNFLLNNIDSDINIFPNPASNEVHVNFVSNNLHKTNISIIDMQGNIIKKISDAKNENQINIKDLSQGIYVILISNANFVKATRFIKQ